MAGQQLYVIEYELHGKHRSFIIRLEKMDNAVAWHWASCDAGVGIIPRFGQQNIKMVSRPMAERHGIAGVRWQVAGRGGEFVPRPIAVQRRSDATERA
ncbi:DUF6555 family protein [Pseudomonas fulva]|nr:DUF6555 family protein [Pseudomonas fulva]MBF8780433.1 hypothetical protein [Pseudomonas fulva]